MKKIFKLFILLLIFLGIFYSLRYLYRIYNADKGMMDSESLLQQGNVVDSLEKIDNAIDQNPQEPIYYRTRARVYLALGVGPDQKEVSKFKDRALSDLKKAYSLNPHNLATIRNIVPLYYYLAVKDLSAPASLENLDPAYINFAGNFYRETARDYSTDVGVMVLLAKYQNKLGLKEDLSMTVDRIRFLRPDLLEWHESLRDLNVSL